MILRRIALRDFRRFASFETDFAPGVNVIQGENEAGKSTLREAITLALFQDPKTSDRKVLDLKRWGAGEQFAIILELEEDGKSFVLTKDFQSKAARLEECGPDGTGQGVLTDAKTIEARIKEMLGLGSRAIFESTVRIFQRDITLIQGGQGIADSLQKLVTGGEQDVHASKVLDELDRALRALKTAAKSNPGPLSVLPNRITAKEAELENRRRSLDRAEKAKTELITIQGRLETAQLGLAGKEAMERDCAERLRLEGELARAQEEEVRLDTVVEQVRNYESAIASDESALGRYAKVLAVPQQEVSQIEVLAARAAAPPAEQQIAQPATMMSPSPRISWIVAGVVMAAAGVAGAFFHLGLLTLLLVGVTLVVWELSRSRKGSIDAVGLAAQLRAQERKEAAEKAASRLREVLSSVDCSSVGEFHTRRHEGEAIQQRVGVTKARLEGLLAGRAIDVVEEGRKAASRKVRNLQESLDETRMLMARMDPADYQRLVNDIQRLKKEIETLQKEMQDLQVTVRANQATVDEVHLLEEEAQALGEQLAAARERQQVLELVRDVLGEARDATMVSARDVLEQDLGKLIQEITGGRYSEVRVDASKLSIELISSEKGMPVAVALEGELSTGTVEQVYLAARLAIARLLAQGRRPPFILDDPFVTFDAPRTAAVLALCKRLTAENQVLLFTCHQGYETAAGKTIKLPELSQGYVRG